EAINLLALQKDKHQVVFVNELSPELVLRGDSQRLIQVFINLLSNSRDASPPDSHVTVTGSTEQGFVTVAVTDEGAGIPTEIRDRVFEPFFTTKDPGD